MPKIYFELPIRYLQKTLCFGCRIEKLPKTSLHVPTQENVRKRFMDESLTGK